MQAIDTLTTLELPRDYIAPRFVELDLDEVPTTRFERVVERNTAAQVRDLVLLLAVVVFALAVGFALS